MDNSGIVTAYRKCFSSTKVMQTNYLDPFLDIHVLFIWRPIGLGLQGNVLFSSIHSWKLELTLINGSLFVSGIGWVIGVVDSSFV